ncbi:SDR family oxidoreductase [Pelagibacterium sp. H642]|uniref:SDR family oxidoreductase n=1 Tax=Pelagibacterium sp. H642 TaxID=1881069 RepID=UPI002816243B|nr:SDR family oxidoreductase [Pelagibacterium sp. H642]WMT92888.1 SDR family oxidoreductase [Pelagibacterium sp. H642]
MLSSRPLNDAVVVITGASSGIGRASAILFAREGTRLVLASRNLTALEPVAAKCRTAGAETLAFRIDMADEQDVEQLRTDADRAFGRIDVWVNCAAVLFFGRFEDVPANTFKHIIDNNLMGYVHGAKAAIVQFRRQGDRGTLINVASMLGVVSEPNVSAYVASKFAIRGLTASIRQEMANSPSIRVCTILPAAIDTPIYQKAGNLCGKRARSILPVYRTERAAKAILRVAKRPRREVRVGGFAFALDLACRLAPSIVELSIGRFGPGLQFTEEPQPPSDGNLRVSKPPHVERGGWREHWRRRLGLSSKEDPPIAGMQKRHSSEASTTSEQLRNTSKPRSLDDD